MSYMTDKFEAGEVKIRGQVCGWEFDDGEFRPLMQDAMDELYNEGFVTQNHVMDTAVARGKHEAEFLAEYVANHSGEASAEEKSEMRAAFGAGSTVVNVLTGRKTTL